MTQQLQFIISGDFVTDIARTWFWKENQPYEKAENLLLDCLITDKLTLDERKAIARDILEYRKQLVGDNAFTIEDDPGPVRPITEKLKQLEFTSGVQALRQRLETDPLPFVDPYSTMKSIKALKEGITPTKWPFTREKCVQYFGHTEPNYITGERDELPAFHAPLWAGLWLFDELELAYNICQDITCHIGDDAFWAEVYNRTKDRDGFRERNARYQAHLATEKARAEWFRKPFTEQFPDIPEKPKKEIWENPEPDNMLCWEGLVDPKGNFYSCEFGAHNAKAHTIIYANIDEWTKLASPEEIAKSATMDKALDILINHGWCATRILPMRGEYITYPNNYRITKAQKDTLWNAIIKFDMHPDIEEPLI